MHYICRSNATQKELMESSMELSNGTSIGTKVYENLATMLGFHITFLHNLHSF